MNFGNDPATPFRGNKFASPRVSLSRGAWPPKEKDMDEAKSASPDRRQALKCMLWAGTGVVWTVSGGVPVSRLIGEASAEETGFSFVQISDSHIGFSKPANPDARGTLKEAIAKIAATPRKPAFLLHTGDISHLAKREEFDDAQQIIGESGLETHYAPGEHDIVDATTRDAYLERFGKGATGGGWYAFDHKGVHFVSLNNVVDLKTNGLGSLGPQQLAWLENDLKGRSASTPIVVFAHIPLWMIAPDWGWGTQDGARVLAMLSRFGSATVLNGHIHQLMQKVEGRVTFHTARSTAFPQPAPGTAPGPGPKLVPAGELRKYLGVAEVVFDRKTSTLAITDEALLS
jgi:3',5'-cyclic AMP phosphodiesterase CpdA